ncbi:light-harvesting protein B-800-850 alpha chain [Rhodopseudomonas faecalis]|uniref:Light-harvesting protein B-800-850 alpha chain n=1 Tax=Rhodopseudomonas faecalis TaxID=99655 RepID=A0A318TE63_9BRAD|nr:light-harvesting protein [Rhodopseudomonas faecalis]PYF02140.1 light-harvesting protein B-800-850 alpha chain [Rhodopseudomonas faecalis]TAH67062.1 MAG: light-harvesting protein [Rhodopseudomonas palustris]
MNQGRIWTVVNPGVGLPLFLGSVAVIAILVHAAVLNNTTWFPKYWNGGGATAAAPVAAPAAPAAPAKK